MSTQPSVPAEDDLPEQLRIRREKRAHLIERGVDPYPVAVARTHTLKEIREKYAALETDTATGYGSTPRSMRWARFSRRIRSCSGRSSSAGTGGCVLIGSGVYLLDIFLVNKA